MNQHVVFVYGTLLRGEHNNDALRTATFLTEARTKSRFYAMADFGAYPAVFSPGIGEMGQVIGELFSVDGDTLCLLDELEGHPNFYRRELVPVEGGRDNWAWMYVLSARTVRSRSYKIVPSLDWRKRCTD